MMNFLNRNLTRQTRTLILLPLVLLAGGACASPESNEQTMAEVTSTPGSTSGGASVSGSDTAAPSTVDSSPGGTTSVAPSAEPSSSDDQSPTGSVASSSSPSDSGNSSPGDTASGAGGAGAGGSGGAAADDSGPAGAGGSGGAAAEGSGGAAAEGSGGAAAEGSGGATVEGSGGAAGGAGGAESGGDSDSDVVPSAGCNVADGPEMLTAGGSSVAGGLPTSTRLGINDREYIVDIPADYDPAHPYRLIFSWHQAYGSAEGNANGQYPANNGPNFDAEHYAFFGLHRVATEANDPVIFVSPQGIGNFPWDYDRDVVLFDELLARVTEHLCIDESRVFTTGFSFGAMMSHALSIGRASKLRGAVTMAPANYNFTQPTGDGTRVAYFGITGMSDGTCPWVNSDQQRRGGKYCVLTHAENNGCTIPDDIQTAAGGSNAHVCLDFEGCQEGYPVKVCTFDGNHTPSSISDGTSGDDGERAFTPPLAWEFISQL